MKKEPWKKYEKLVDNICFDESGAKKPYAEHLKKWAIEIGLVVNGEIKKVLNRCLKEQQKIKVGKRFEGKQNMNKTLKQLKPDNIPTQNQVDLLAKFLIENFEEEIGKGESPNGEGAIEMAVRLLIKLKDHLEKEI